MKLDLKVKNVTYLSYVGQYSRSRVAEVTNEHLVSNPSLLVCKSERASLQYAELFIDSF